MGNAFCSWCYDEGSGVVLSLWRCACASVQRRAIPLKLPPHHPVHSCQRMGIRGAAPRNKTPIECKPRERNPWDVDEFNHYSSLGLFVSGISGCVIAVHYEYQFATWNANPQQTILYRPVALTCTIEYVLWVLLLVVAGVFELVESSIFDFSDGGSHIMHAKVYENDPFANGNMLHSNISNVEHMQLYFFWLIAATTAFAEMRQCAPEHTGVAMFCASFFVNAFTWHAHSSTRTPTEGLQYQIYAWLYFAIGVIFGLEEYTKDYRWLGMRAFFTGLLGTWYLAMARTEDNGWPIDIVHIGSHVIENTDDIGVLPHGTAMMLTSTLFIQCVLFVVLSGLTIFIALNNLISRLNCKYDHRAQYHGVDADDGIESGEAFALKTTQISEGYNSALSAL